MLNSSSLRYVIGVFMSCLMAVSHAQELNSRWRLRVMDLQHQVKVDATLRFAGDPAGESCMAGAWKRLVVEAKTSSDEKFFPLKESLAYEVERGELTLGRTAVCDGYLFLTGKLNDLNIQGTYYALSIGSSQNLGYFSLHKIRQE